MIALVLVYTHGAGKSLKIKKAQEQNIVGLCLHPSVCSFVRHSARLSACVLVCNRTTPNKNKQLCNRKSPQFVCNSVHMLIDVPSNHDAIKSGLSAYIYNRPVLAPHRLLVCLSGCLSVCLSCLFNVVHFEASPRLFAHLCLCEQARVLHSIQFRLAGKLYSS